MFDVVDIASYADDNILYSIESNQCELEKNIQKLSVQLFKEFLENRMNDNKDKCHFPSSFDQSEKFSLLISIIKNSGFLHHFGVIIERKLNFNEHVTNLCGVIR